MHFYGIATAQIIIVSLIIGSAILFFFLKEGPAILADFLRDFLDEVWPDEYGNIFAKLIYLSLIGWLALALRFIGLGLMTAICVFLFMSVHRPAEIELNHFAKFFPVLSSDAFMISLVGVSLSVGVLIRLYSRNFKILSSLQEKLILSLQIISIMLLPMGLIFISVPIFIGNFEFGLFLPLILLVSIAAGSGWTIAIALLFHALKQEALIRRSVKLKEDYHGKDMLEFLSLKEALILEEGWKDEHFINPGTPYKLLLDRNYNPKHLTLSPDRPKQFGQPLTAINKLMYKGRYIVILSTPLRGDSNPDFNEALFKGATEKLHQITNLLGDRVMLGRDDSVEIEALLDSPNHVLLSRKYVLGRGKLQTALGW